MSQNCVFLLGFSLAEATESKIRWVVRLFESWRKDRNARAMKGVSTVRPILYPLLEMDKDLLNYSLSRFICEVVKANGQDFPGHTLYEMIISIQLYFEQNGFLYKFLCDEEFVQIKNTLDSVMQARAKSGIGIRKKQAEIVSQEEEDIMWDKGVLGSSSPDTLVKTLIYLFGLNFALRAAQDHRNLRWSPNPQIELLTDSCGIKFLRYTEDVSKANRGGLKHRKVKGKVVDAYSHPNKARCIVSLYEMYVSHIPSSRPDYAFYLRPLNKPLGNIWYSSQPLGKHKISETVKILCQDAGIPGYRTNHSLRATSATRLFEHDIDEQRICEITGHRSLAVREYKRTSEHMKKCVSSIIQGSDVSAPKKICLNDNLRSNVSDCIPNLVPKFSNYASSSVPVSNYSGFPDSGNMVSNLVNSPCTLSVPPPDLEDIPSSMPVLEPMVPFLTSSGPTCDSFRPVDQCINVISPIRNFSSENCSNFPNSGHSNCSGNSQNSRENSQNVTFSSSGSSSASSGSGGGSGQFTINLNLNFPKM